MKSVASLRTLGVWGTGTLVMLADTDVGNVVAAAQAGTSWGYRLLPLLFVLVPLLYFVQELTVRLGIFSGRGYGELVRERFGISWSYVSAIALVIATIGSLITQFTGIAGIGELYGISRTRSLFLATTALIAIAGTGSYRRMQNAALFIGAFELVFFALAWAAHPDPVAIWRHALDIPWRNGSFMYLAAALAGAVFSPWMVFYQQSAVVEKGMSRIDYGAERLETAVGAVLTQSITAAVLVTMAALATDGSRTASLRSVSQIADAMSHLLGGALGRVIFSVGALGGAMVAAIVSSLALAWGVGEVAGFRRSLECRPMKAPWFYALYVAAVMGCALLVGYVPDLIALNLIAQVLNALLSPLVTGLLIALADVALPAEYRPQGWYRLAIVAGAFGLGAMGLVGTLGMLL
ncbi:NRAMP family divalent metal transporter [Paraburkholderia diazotrophica]|uniref:NRAMP family divalent metal transporter n=1 Tax=Paraburkholderia diazotrophica TaxID=667676 RepID=UPI0031807350